MDRKHSKPRWAIALIKASHNPNKPIDRNQNNPFSSSPDKQKNDAKGTCPPHIVFSHTLNCAQPL